MAPELIVVGPHEVWRAVVKSVGEGCRVVAFTTLEELDHWRANLGLDDPSIYPDVVVALSESGCRLGALPPKLRQAVEAIGALARVPPKRELEGSASSRRSFYRLWHAQLEITPAAFLRRVRTLHARRLMANGRTKKEAAMLAGYSSVDQMRRCLKREE